MEPHFFNVENNVTARSICERLLLERASMEPHFFNVENYAFRNTNLRFNGTTFLQRGKCAEILPCPVWLQWNHISSTWKIALL